MKLDAKQIAGLGAGGGVTVFTADLDFGSVGVASKLFALANGAASVGQSVFVNLPWDAPGGVDVDELEMDPIFPHGVVSADGIVSIQLVSISGSKVYGARRVEYFLV